MNSKYALQPLRWELLEYVNLLSCPWNGEHLFHLHNKISGEGWEHPVEQSLSSSLHPTGLLLAIGFRDCFKVYAVTNNGLSGTNLGDAVRECRSLCYSTHGNHLAVMSLSNVHIYNSYTCERLQIVQHPQSSIIKKLKYVQNELHCITRTSKFYSYSMYNNYSQVLQFAPREFLPSSQKDSNFDVIEYDPEYEVYVTTRNN